jgi:predicted  nucleic acid-binding Zn ribbon protein
VSARCAALPTWRFADDQPESTRSWSDECELYVFTHMFDETSPVCSGSDGEPVPLYLLPIDDEGRRTATHWMAQYKRYDHLQLDCGPLEVEAYRQLADPASALASDGRELALEVERATKLPTYYYLLRYWGWADREDERPCPGCGEPWRNPRPRTAAGMAWFDFRCDRCRLVSHVASSFEDDGHPEIGSFEERTDDR